MLRKSIASEWLALCLISCVLVSLHPGSLMLADFVDTITGEVIVIKFQFHPWLFENLEQLVTLYGIASKTEVICWLSRDCLSITLLPCCKSKSHVTIPFLFVGSTPSDVCQDFDTCLVG